MYLGLRFYAIRLAVRWLRWHAGRDGRSTAPKVLFRASAKPWAEEVAQKKLPWSLTATGARESCPNQLPAPCHLHLYGTAACHYQAHFLHTGWTPGRRRRPTRSSLQRHGIAAAGHDAVSQSTGAWTAVLAAHCLIAPQGGRGMGCSLAGSARCQRGLQHYRCCGSLLAWVRSTARPGSMPWIGACNYRSLSWTAHNWHRTAGTWPSPRWWRCRRPVNGSWP